ncbi:hypothetical protein Bca4012_074525 [Brassica carinata]
MAYDNLAVAAENKPPENQQRNLKPIESTDLTRMVKPRTPTHREAHEVPAGTERTNRRVCNKNRGRTRQRERSSSSNSKRRKLSDLKRATPDLNFKQKLRHYCRKTKGTEKRLRETHRHTRGRKTDPATAQGGGR